MLADRWPDASVLGLDSSPDMIEAARGTRERRVRFELGGPAALDSVDAGRRHRQQRHPAVGPRSPRPAAAARSAALAPGGWLAFQVPGNFDEPSHRLLRELAADPRFAERYLGTSRFRSSHDPDVYLADLGAPRLRRRRVGDDLPARPRRA